MTWRLVCDSDRVMYIRATTQKKDGTIYKTFRLVESSRTERGPRQRTVLNLGTGFSLPEEQWKELANRIEEIITAQKNIFPYPPDIEDLAKIYVQRIIVQGVKEPTKGTWAEGSSPQAMEENVSDYQSVDVNSIETADPRTVGAEHVVLETIRQLKLEKELLELGFTRHWKDVALGVIAGRLIHPSSELGTHWWLKNASGIGELLRTDFGLLSQDRVYRVSDKLLQHRDELEEYLSRQEKRMFSLQETVILYDLTNTFFEGTMRHNHKAKFGRSKEKRTDCPLLTLGLALDGDGFSKRSRVFEGNVSEPGTLETMLQGMIKPPLLFKPLVVMDAGIATEANLQWLKDNQYDYLAVSRRRQKEIPEGLFERMTAVKIDHQDHEQVRAALIHNEDNQEVEVWCHSIGKEKKEEGMQSLARHRFEDGLKQIASGLTKKHGTKRYDKVVERIGRLKQKYSRMTRHFEITIEKGEKDSVAGLSWEWKENTGNANGVYCLRTNRQGLDEQKLWNLYNMIRDVEDAFRAMKSDLGLRPVRHHTENRADGHLFITVLAYHILHTIRYKLRQQGIHDSWSTIREKLSLHIRTTTILKKEDKKVIHVRKTSRTESYQKRIYQALGIAEVPGKTVKTVF